MRHAHISLTPSNNLLPKAVPDKNRLPVAYSRKYVYLAVVGNVLFVAAIAVIQSHTCMTLSTLMHVEHQFVETHS